MELVVQDFFVIQGGEVLCELGSSDQWSFDLVWCPRNPAVVATAGFDGKVSVHSLMGGTELPAGPSQPSAASAAIAESFPGMENMQLPSAMVKYTAQQRNYVVQWNKFKAISYAIKNLSGPTAKPDARSIPTTKSATKVDEAALWGQFCLRWQVDKL